MKPQTRLELDLAAAAGCQSPDCTHENHEQLFYLIGRCHPVAGVTATYKAGSGILVIQCAMCERFIASIAVAQAPV